MDEIIVLFNSRVTTDIINQTKATPSYVLDKYFMPSQKGVLANSVDIPIKKGSSIVLKSVSPEAEHIVVDRGDELLVTVSIPRFPIENTISAKEINQMKTFDNSRDKKETMAKKIADITKEHKNHFTTTLEYMAVGALFNKVMDGHGKVLFELENQAHPVEFKSTKTLIECLNEIEDKLIEELGYAPKYSILSSRTFINKIVTLANNEKLFENKEARWESKEDDTRVLVVHGVEFRPYSAKYKNSDGVVKNFIEDNSAIVTPHSEDVYGLYYTNADHTDAIGKKPTLYFTAAPEKLPKGRGYGVVSEMKAIPVCTRPSALIKLKAE